MMDASIIPLPIAACSVEKARLGCLLSRLVPSVQLSTINLNLRLGTPLLKNPIKLVFSFPSAPGLVSDKVICLIAQDQAYPWFAEWMGGADVEAIPRSLLLPLLPERFEQCGEPLRTLLGQRARFERCVWESEYRSDEVTLLLETQTSAGSALNIWVDQGVEALLQRWPKNPPMWPTTGSVQLTALVGTLALNVWEYSSLGVGDVVFFEQCLIPQGIVVLKINGVQCWQGTFEGAAITLTHPLTTPLLEQEDMAVSDLERIPVNLNFEIGSARLNLKEIAQLQAGYVFELNETTDQPVKVLIDDQVVGRGELVSLNNKLGVRLTKWQGKELNPQAESSVE